jgi:predicted DNA-binding protein
MPLAYCVVMKRTSLFLKSEQVEKLSAMSKKTGAPVAEIVRRAVDEYLKRRGHAYDTLHGFRRACKD